MDITPLIPANRQIISGYGNGGFSVNGARHEGSIFVSATQLLPWTVSEWAQFTAESLAPLEGQGIELILIGCGAQMQLLAPDLRRHFRAQGIALETMDTGAACRTYNVLLAEERRVAAALIAV
jgi:uncharacterized protein